MLDELPLLARLQQRKPEIYKPQWNCIMCGIDKETWPHLWICPVIAPELTNLWDTIRANFLDKLINHEKISTTGLSTDISLAFQVSSCWSLPTEDAQSTQDLNFKHLLRGFVPRSLRDIVYTALKTQPLTQDFIADLISDTQSHFKDFIWKPRCESIILFEKDHNITTKMKKSSSPTSRPSRVPPVATQVLQQIDRWQSWITQAMKTGFLWQDFHTCINSLAF